MNNSSDSSREDNSNLYQGSSSYKNIPMAPK